MPEQSLSGEEEIPAEKLETTQGRRAGKILLLVTFTKRTFPFIGHARFPFRVR